MAASLPHQLSDAVFVTHQAVPRPGMELSSHVGGAHGVVSASQLFLHFFFCFLHLVADASPLHWSNRTWHSSSQLWHGGCDGGGADDDEGGGGVGEGGGGEGDGGGGLGAGSR